LILILNQLRNERKASLLYSATFNFQDNLAS